MLARRRNDRDLLSWSCQLVAKPPVTLQAQPSRDTRAEAARWCSARRDLLHVPDATLARIPSQRFCPDTEAVIASMNVRDA